MNRRSAGETVTVAQVRTPEEIAAVETLLREYTTWAFSLEPDSDFAPTFQSLQHELSTLPGIYAPPVDCCWRFTTGSR